jgi:hypothetical protein
MIGDGFCGYYAIISQGNSKEYGGDTLGPFNKNQEVKNDGREITNEFKEKVVIPYLRNFQIYWREEDGGESFKKFMNE